MASLLPLPSSLSLSLSLSHSLSLSLSLSLAPHSLLRSLLPANPFARALSVPFIQLSPHVAHFPALEPILYRSLASGITREM